MNAEVAGAEASVAGAPPLSDAKALEDAIKKLSERLTTNSLHLADVENKKDITVTINGLTSAFSGTRKYYASKILTILKKIKEASAIGSSATKYLPTAKTGAAAFFTGTRNSTGIASAKTSLDSAGDIEAGKYKEFGEELANLKEDESQGVKKIIYAYLNPNEDFWKKWFDRMTNDKSIYFSNGNEELPFGGGDGQDFNTVIKSIKDEYNVLYPPAGGAAGGGSSSRKTRNIRRRRRRYTRRW